MTVTETLSPAESEPKILINLQKDEYCYTMCGASEEMAEISVEDGFYIVIKNDQFEGLLKFAGVISFICTKHIDESYQNKWYIPYKEGKGEPYFINPLLSSLIEDNSKLPKMLESLDWLFSIDSKWEEIPPNIAEIIDRADLGVTPVINEELKDIGDYVDWKEQSSKRGYALASEE